MATASLYFTGSYILPKVSVYFTGSDNMQMNFVHENLEHSAFKTHWIYSLGRFLKDMVSTIRHVVFIYFIICFSLRKKLNLLANKIGIGLYIQTLNNLRTIKKTANVFEIA